MLPTFEEAREALAEQVGASVLAHSERTADTAARIAAAYGADVPAARAAGLLHDWSKGVEGAVLISMARRWNLQVTAVDIAVPYLLHAPVGACEVGAAFPGIDPAVTDAIAAHTCGALELTPLSMVVYIADAIEPGRSHDGVQALRGAVGSVPLPELFARTYASSVRHLIERRRPVHPVTTEVWNRFVAEAAR